MQGAHSCPAIARRVVNEPRPDAVPCFHDGLHARVHLFLYRRLHRGSKPCCLREANHRQRIRFVGVPHQCCYRHAHAGSGRQPHNCTCGGRHKASPMHTDLLSNTRDQNHDIMGGGVFRNTHANTYARTNRCQPDALLAEQLVGVYAGQARRGRHQRGGHMHKCTHAVRACGITHVCTQGDTLQLTNNRLCKWGPTCEWHNRSVRVSEGGQWRDSNIRGEDEHGENASEIRRR